HWFCEPKASLTDNSTAQHSSPTTSDTLGVCARKSDKFAIAVACLRISLKEVDGLMRVTQNQAACGYVLGRMASNRRCLSW
ncbi:MAG: hypothetical protein NT013_29370, partial [Planctomycetia bacterium]|nr:hypothetical protein [Planctomycetia bacterium]